MDTKKFVVVGGGLGGLITAIILQKNGYQVTIVEKNSRVGGLLQSFKRKSCTFDTGMHYIGSMDEGQIMHKIFRYLNILNQLKLERMDDDGYDIFNINDKEYKIPFGWEAFRKRLLNYFPEEEEAISKYIKKVKEVVASHDLFNLRTPVDFDISKTASLQQGVYDFIQGLTANKDLQNLLAALNSIYAGQKNKSSLYVHSVIHEYYSNSAYKIVGGGESIAVALRNEFENHGGKIVLNEKVLKFESIDKEVSAVVTEKGSRYEADFFISNIHPALTLEMLDPTLMRKSYRKRIQSIENTISTFGIHVKLKEGAFPKLNANYHRYLKDDVWAVDAYDSQEWPQEYFLYTPAQSAGQSQCFSVYTYMKFDEVAQWADTTIKNRSVDYKEWKRQKGQQLLAVVAKDFPMIKGNIAFIEELSPLSYRDYVNNAQGEIYGIQHDFNNALHSYIFPNTKVKNLFFTGQNINMHGMLGVAIGSLLSVSAFVDIDEVVNEINKRD